MTRQPLRLMLLLVLGTVLVACRPPAEPGSSSRQTVGGTSVRLELEGEPRLGTADILVQVLKNGEGVSGATVELTGDMTHAGMIPVVASTQETEAGLYRSQGFEFTMAGDWIITAGVRLPDGTRAAGELSVTVPGN